MAVAFTDRQKLAVLLQAGGLLSHLRLAGWRLLDGWRSAAIDEDGVLRGVAAGPGRADEWAQESLVELAALLFDSPAGEVVGRGQARRVARELIGDWRQQLVPLSPDEAVRQLLERARFLWERPHARARRCLAGEHRRGGRRRLWVAGPGWFRRRVLGGAESWDRLCHRLESSRAASCWRDPAAQPTAHGIERARRLLAGGRFESADRLLDTEPGPAAEALAVACRARLGRLESARRRLRRVDPRRLADEDLAELAETAVWLYGTLGRPDGARPWLRRALRAEAPSARRRAFLAAASSAWDAGELERMGRYLELARPARADPRTAWRWRQVAGLGALARRDPAAACRHFGRALGDCRRRLGKFDAASLWNDLAVARAGTGDLAGAERALRHSVRLHQEVDGPRRTTLALFNLASVRMRRGRPRGVRAILERSERLNLRSGNRRALAYDRELLARLELLSGHPERALEIAAGTLEELTRHGVDARREELHAVAARALGWLGRRRAAERALERCAGSLEHLFESEELPALWALCGRLGRARRAIRPGPAGPIWTAVLSDRTPPSDAWRELERLDDYRAARLIADLEQVRPGVVPRARIRWALGLFEALGARWLAGRLESSLEGAWSAVERYLVRGGDAPVETLFEESGYRDVSLAWRRRGVARALVSGEGGPATLRAGVAGGELVLEAEHVDARLRALFALVARDWRPPEPSGAPAPHGVIGESPALRASLERAARLATGELPVLILGETGTGKELVARYVHRASRRRGGPLVPLNSAAVSESLLLSELFGHTRGAFTGADRDRLGIFEAARGGTVFLDELGDLPSSAQGMLLRVLQEGEVRRLGENRSRPVDVRVVAATHRRLEERVEDGRFRADLYYRLAVGTVELPPLRQRGDDLELLVRHFLDRFAAERRLVLSTAAAERLRSHDFPGNVRELANRLAVAAALAEQGVIRVRHLGLPDSAPRPTGSYHQQVLELRRRLVRDALRVAAGNRARAARRLGVSRQALSYLVRTLDLE